MEERQRLEIAERIRVLRERSPYTQPDVAEKLGIKLRGYQKLEKEGTTKFDRCEAIYEIHKPWIADDPEWAYVSAGWIWDGKERGSADLSDALSEAEPASPAKLEKMLQEVLDQQAQLIADVSEVRAAQEHLSPLIERLGRAPEGKRKGSSSS
jgi:transcriptional regulator with XRE-family HTH domain